MERLLRADGKGIFKRVVPVKKHATNIDMTEGEHHQITIIHQTQKGGSMPSEKDMFIQTFQREAATTMKILKQLPADKADYTPTAEKTKSAKGLAEVFIGELGVLDGIVKGKIDFGGEMPKFASYADVLNAYDTMQQQAVTKVQAMSEADWNSMITVPVGPKQMGQIRRADMAWMMLMDSVHHRGQFSIYLRLVGAKVPSIYGPSADEPWM
jgi:uncharacterized damage-inducible protein DinB